MLTYSELITYKTYEERLEYLRTGLPTSEISFDKLRSLNQKFYNSAMWKRVRSSVIARDLGYDLAVPGMEIIGKILIHHIKPLVPKDIYLMTEYAIDPEFLVTTSYKTHQAIHFGIEPEELPLNRQAGDTRLW